MKHGHDRARAATALLAALYLHFPLVARAGEAGLTDPAAVDRAVADMQALFGAINWMPPPFQALLAGTINHLPTRKISLRLFKKDAGFLGAGDFRQHFFGDSNMASVVRAFVREKARYSAASLALQRRFTHGITQPVGQD